MEHEVVPYVAWSPSARVPTALPPPEDAPRAFRQIDACRENRQRVVLGGAGGLVLIAAYLVAHLTPTVPSTEVFDLLESKLPTPALLPPSVRYEVVQYVEVAQQPQAPPPPQPPPSRPWSDSAWAAKRVP